MWHTTRLGATRCSGTVGVLHALHAATYTPPQARLFCGWHLQIERYACLYTSHVSNLAFVSPSKTFMGRVDIMAHEWLDGAQAANAAGDS